MEKGTKAMVSAITVLLMASSPMLMAQTGNPQQFSRKVDRLFAERKSQSTPGAAVVVTKKGKPIFKRCYGLADVEHKIPITSKTM